MMCVCVCVKALLGKPSIKISLKMFAFLNKKLSIEKLVKERLEVLVWNKNIKRGWEFTLMYISIIYQ